MEDSYDSNFSPVQGLNIVRVNEDNATGSNDGQKSDTSIGKNASSNVKAEAEEIGRTWLSEVFEKAEEKWSHKEMERKGKVSSGGELERKSCGDEEREATTSWLSGIYEQAEKQWSESELRKLGNTPTLKRKISKGSASKNSPDKQTTFRKNSDQTPKNDSPDKQTLFRKNSDQT